MNKTDKVLSLMAHEYRVPLGLISMHTEMVTALCGMEEIDCEAVKKEMSVIKHYCNRLEYVTSLVLSSEQQKNYILSSHTGNIDEFFTTLAENASLYFSSSNAKVIFKNNLSDNEFCCDYSLLEQISLNLVSNAIKYNNKKTKKVCITAKENKISTILEFKDNGIGIEYNDIEKIFNKHYITKRGKECSAKGLGLGLYIVKEAVSCMCGSISVKSEPDKGTVFTITLPKNLTPETGFREMSKGYFSESIMNIYRTDFENI